jgi:hypothetical protein
MNSNYIIICVDYDHVFEPEVQQQLLQTLRLSAPATGLMTRKSGSKYSLTAESKERLERLYRPMSELMQQLGPLFVNRAKGYTMYAVRMDGVGASSSCSLVLVQQAVLAVRASVREVSKKVRRDDAL